MSRSDGSGRGGTPDMRPGRGLAAALAVVAAAALAGCAARQGSEPARSLADDPSGIRPEALRLSAAGYVLDFRYRVVDPARAAPLLDGRKRPFLVDGRGASLGVPDTPILGSLRQTSRNGKVATDHSYFIIFANPGKYLRSGDRVTLVVGDSKVTDLTVE
jgi:hypothetical protein